MSYVNILHIGWTSNFHTFLSASGKLTVFHMNWNSLSRALTWIYNILFLLNTKCTTKHFLGQFFKSDFDYWRSDHSNIKSYLSHCKSNLGQWRSEYSDFKSYLSHYKSDLGHWKIAAILKVISATTKLILANEEVITSTLKVIPAITKVILATKKWCQPLKKISKPLQSDIGHWRSDHSLFESCLSRYKSDLGH